MAARTRRTRSATLHRAVELGVTLLRHGGGLRSIHQRGAGRQGAETRARQGEDRHQIRLQRSSRPATDRSSSLASTAGPSMSAPWPKPRCSAWASSRSTSTTSTASTPTCRSRTRSARWPIWCARARCARSACRRRASPPSAGRMRCIRSPPCRANIRCGPAIRKTGVLDVCRELGIGFVPFSPLGRGFLAGAIKSSRSARRGRFPPRPAALRGGEHQAQSGRRRQAGEAGGRQGQDISATRARLGAAPGRFHRADPRLAQDRQSRGQRRGGGHRAQRCRGGRDRRAWSRRTRSSASATPMLQWRTTNR